MNYQNDDWQEKGRWQQFIEGILQKLETQRLDMEELTKQIERQNHDLEYLKQENHLKNETIQVLEQQLFELKVQVLLIQKGSLAPSAAFVSPSKNPHDTRVASGDRSSPNHNQNNPSAPLSTSKQTHSAPACIDAIHPQSTVIRSSNNLQSKPLIQPEKSANPIKPTKTKNLDQTNIKQFKSKIVDKSDFHYLFEWTKAQKLLLLYRASKHGFDAKRFHKKCDGKGATLTIVKDTKNNVFGGFTSIPWSSPASWELQTDETAFLFTLVNHQAIPPQQFRALRVAYISQHPNYGPSFGEIGDLLIDSNPNQNRNSFAVPMSYVNSTGKKYPFTGEEHFTVADYEVFLVE